MSHMDTTPTLTIAPALPAAAVAPLMAAAVLVDPAIRTGCAWYVVPAELAAPVVPAHRHHPHPHAA